MIESKYVSLLVFITVSKCLFEVDAVDCTVDKKTLLFSSSILCKNSSSNNIETYGCLPSGNEIDLILRSHHGNLFYCTSAFSVILVWNLWLCSCTALERIQPQFIYYAKHKHAVSLAAVVPCSRATALCVFKRLLSLKPQQGKHFSDNFICVSIATAQIERGVRFHLWMWFLSVGGDQIFRTVLFPSSFHTCSHPPPLQKW